MEHIAEKDGGAPPAVVVVVVRDAQYLDAIAHAVTDPLRAAGAVEQVYAGIGPVADAVIAGITAPGECVCDTGPGTEGPSETCPQHGRPYSFWVDFAAGEIERANAAEAERDRLLNAATDKAEERAAVQITALQEFAQYARQMAGGTVAPGCPAYAEHVFWRRMANEVDAYRETRVLPPASDTEEA